MVQLLVHALYHLCYNYTVKTFLFEKIMKEGEAGDHSRVPRNCLYHCLVRKGDSIKIEHHLDEKGKSIVKNKA